jgi:hypothetical protein
LQMLACALCRGSLLRQPAKSTNSKRLPARDSGGKTYRIVNFEALELERG